MSIKFIGTLNGVDNYNRIKIIVDDPTIITKKINDVNNPYKYIDNNKLECYLVPTKYKNYHIFAAEAHKYKKVDVNATIKRYCFDGKKGTSLILKSFELSDIELI